MLPKLIFAMTVCLACIFPVLVLIRILAKERLYAWEARTVQHCKQTWGHGPHFTGWLIFISFGFIETLYTASMLGDFLQGSDNFHAAIRIGLSYAAAMTSLWGGIHCWRGFTAALAKTRTMMPSLCSAALMATFLSCGLAGNHGLDMPTSAEAGQNAMNTINISAATLLLWVGLGLWRKKRK